MSKSTKAKSGRPSVRAYTLLKRGQFDDLVKLAEKSYGITLDPATGPEAMKTALEDAAREKFAREYKPEPEAAHSPAEEQPSPVAVLNEGTAPVPPILRAYTPPQPPPTQEHLTQSQIDAATEEARQAEIAKLPKDPWVASGRTPGKVAPVSGLYNEDGALLLPDTDPVLSDEEWETELGLIDQRFLQTRDKKAQALIDKMPESIRPKAVKPPFRHNTNPVSPKAFLNPRTEVYFRPTEKLMRNRDLVPVYADPPLDVIYGT